MSYSARGLRKADRYSRRAHRQAKRLGEFACDGCYSCGARPLAHVTRREWHARTERIPALASDGSDWEDYEGKYAERMVWPEYSTGWRSSGAASVPNWVRVEAEEEYALQCTLWALAGHDRICDVHGIPADWCHELTNWWYDLVALMGRPNGWDDDLSEWLLCPHDWSLWPTPPSARRHWNCRGRLWRAPRY